MRAGAGLIGECDLSMVWSSTGHRFVCKVYLEDVDQGGIVYHANYLKYAERARTELLLTGGVSHAEVMGRGEGAVVVSGLSIRYLRPLRLEETLEVWTKIKNIAKVSAVLDQRIVRNGAVMAELEVKLAYLAPSGRPALWPEAVRRALLSGSDERGRDHICAV